MKNTYIVFIPGWPNESIPQYLKRLANQTPDSSARWKSVTAVSDPSLAKYAVCQDNPISIEYAKKLGFAKNNILYIKREADGALPPLRETEVGLTYQGCKSIIPAVWWIDIPFNSLVKMTRPKKERLLSAIVSDCRNTQAHVDRINFIQQISNLLDFDVYGRGHKESSFNNNYCGPLIDANRCKRKGLLNYSNSICIENRSENGYITEKFNDALLCFSKPIYYGAKNAKLYYPERSFFQINSITRLDSLEAIIDYLSIDSCEDDNIEDARERLLFKYNIWNIVESMVVHMRE